MSLTRYPAYKDSGVHWLGTVPLHWALGSFRHAAAIENGRDFKPFEVQEGGYPVLGSGGEFARASRYLFDKPSVLLGRKGTIDNPMFIEEPFWTVDTLFYTRVRADICPKFLFYYCCIIPFDLFEYGSAVPSMTQRDIYAMTVPRPPIHEQSAIISFLDHETAKIDGLVAEQQRLIALLRERRQAIIAHAVTKGLNPDAPMKPSGIDWFGDVPEHWTPLKLSHAVDIIGSGTTPRTDVPAFYDDGDVPWVNTGDLNDNVLVATSRHVTTCAVTQLSSLRVYSVGSVVIAMYGATIGKVGILAIPATVNQACCVFSGGSQLTTRFLFYWFLAFRRLIVSQAIGGGQPNVSQAILRALRIVCPSPDEQATITGFLDAELARCDALILEAERASRLLNERRDALIAAAVTGQIDVRGIGPAAAT